MPPKKASASSNAGGDEKRKVVCKTIEFKKELIAKYESGVHVNEQQLAGFSISEDVICGKARQLYRDLINKDHSMVPEGFDFKSSRGWFEKFRKSSGIHFVVHHGEAGSSDKDAAEKFKVEFANFVKAEEYHPQQIFYFDKTEIFWKKMLQRTYITHEENPMPGHKPMKNRFTLLLCSNASGDYKIKPLLVFLSDNPRAFMKSKLPVVWRSNTKAWLTRQYFTEWVHEVFAPAMKKYLEEKKLPLLCLFMIDNAFAHPSGLEDDLTDEFDFIKIKFLPPNMTPLLQPMDQ
ncbi:tigger transposable element-derived protein 1-like [Palaemon carinicauda]|uniref:tigger transposable element-derived protein 1-like n=1 Tax=Palaemon carinicauda TaxID=392227 RepID=UPI0035B67C8A